MFRWLIRIFFIALCMACVVAWVGSYFQLAFMEYIERNGYHSYHLGIDCGTIIFRHEEQDAFEGGSWFYIHYAADLAQFRRYVQEFKYHFAGFAYQPDKAVSRGNQVVLVPLWCPTFFSALILWFAWRKTKAKPVGRAFPIEPTVKAE
ncbi:MAG TPA: hypothetical protein VGN88_06470 [Phycisphaerae bacterium]|jgi:hypothetical protein